MGSLVFVKGQVPPLTDEQKARLAALKDREIDLSDIPDLRDDEVGKYVRARDVKNLWKKIRVKVIED